MSIRLPSQMVLDQTLAITTGTNTNTILLPQDTDNITILAWAPTLGATSDDIYFQTSPDGGTTWFDLCDIQFTGVTVQQNAKIATFSTVGAIDRSVALTNSAIGAAAASTATANSYTGIPLMGQAFRVFHKIGGSGASTIRVQVLANNQSATA